jgi:sigma-B regulation protein RsbU (phosphoserine phosphatase)
MERPEEVRNFKRITEKTTFKLGVGLPGRVLESGKPAWIVDVTKDPNFPRANLSKNIVIKGAFALPIMAGSDIVGVLEFFSKKTEEPSEELLRNLTNISTTIGQVAHREKTENEIRNQKKRIEKSEERLKYALAGSNDGLWDYHVQTEECYYSPRWQTMLGFKPDELEHNIHSWENLVHPADRNLVVEALNAHLEGQSPSYKTEYRMRKKTGEWAWILARGKVVKRDKSGKAIRVVGTHVDTTERKNLEKKLDAANKRMKGELDIGRDIQMSMLPLIFPAFPDREDFSIYAKLLPAREVGGDFYDFFFIDEQRFCFLIGDVSGKGVPAALFMAVTKTLIKARSTDDYSTASILTHVNDEVSADNKACMFVTLFICILNLKTGELVYTNAGHNPPFIQRGNGIFERLDTLHGPVIGAVDDLTYRENQTTLTSGDSILLYTDGVTEAMDVSGNLFSEQRLVECVSSHQGGSTENVVHSVVEAVKQFEGAADQADDITVLALKYLGEHDKDNTKVFDVTIKNGLPAITETNARFNAFADEHAIPKGVSRKMNMMFDEILNNIISYAYNDEKEHEIDINVELSGNLLAVTISDDGRPFDPFGARTPDTTLSLEEREIGGLGIHLVRNMMDKVTYGRKENKNVVTLVKHLYADGNA